MSEEAGDLRERVIEYMKKADKVKSRDVANALKEKKSLVDKVIKDLAKQDLVEFLYIGTSYVRWKGER